jgi:hypothetical protein
MVRVRASTAPLLPTARLQVQSWFISATFDAIAAAESAGLASLNNLLKATTVDPGGNVMGWVRIGVPGTRPARSRYELQVMAGGEGHLFVFDEAVSQN